ncbi:hypothetical protein A2U01_0066324, partial [Trifolium medium]|nr:hypothetical protein [Trifolium medium]
MRSSGNVPAEFAAEIENQFVAKVPAKVPQ